MTGVRALGLIFAGLFGACGVGSAAIAAHGGDIRLVAIASAMALFHAPALVALAAQQRATPRLAGLAIVLLIVGTVLFSGDLAMLAGTGTSLFNYAAPIGGSTMILAWLTVVAAGIGTAFSHDRHE